MAGSNCIRCGKSTFKLEELKVRDAKYRYYALQCSACGGVVTVVEYFNTGAKVEELSALVTKTSKQVLSAIGAIADGINEIGRRIAKL